MTFQTWGRVYTRSGNATKVCSGARFLSTPLFTDGVIKNRRKAAPLQLTRTVQQSLEALVYLWVWASSIVRQTGQKVTWENPVNFQNKSDFQNKILLMSSVLFFICSPETFCDATFAFQRWFCQRWWTERETHIVLTQEQLFKFSLLLLLWFTGDRDGGSFSVAPRRALLLLLLLFRRAKWQN